MLLHLEECGPTKQNELARILEVERFTMSRLLTKLEASKYVKRARDGTDKIVTPTNATE